MANDEVDGSVSSFMAAIIDCIFVHDSLTASFQPPLECIWNVTINLSITHSIPTLYIIDKILLL